MRGPHLFGFARGDRVKQGPTCPRSLRRMEAGEFREGVVIGFSQNGCIRVHWDGDQPTTVNSYHRKFIERIPPSSPVDPALEPEP